MRQQLRFALGHLGSMLENMGDLAVHLRAPASQQAGVGRIANKGMLEDIAGVRRHAPLKDEPGSDQLLESASQVLLG